MNTAAEASVPKPNFREDYIVSGSAVIFKGSYLETLKVSGSPYAFTVTYEPQGKLYSGTCTAVGDTPATTTINITVSGSGTGTDATASMENCNHWGRSDLRAYLINGLDGNVDGSGNVTKKKL